MSFASRYFVKMSFGTDNRIRFSGHETFVCRLAWLWKGLDFVNKELDFNADDAVVELGVGKNMVASIRHWLRAFGLTDESDALTPFGMSLVGESPDKAGYDPYFEKVGTVWLLHYHLATTGYATLFEYFFDEFQIGHSQFTAEQFLNRVKQKCEEQDLNVSEKSLSKDVAIFLRSYVPSRASVKQDIEELFSGVLIDLGMIRRLPMKTSEDNPAEWFQLTRGRRPDLPWQVVYYSMYQMLQLGGQNISFKDLFNAPKSPGLVFGLSRDGLLEKVEEIVRKMDGKVLFSQTAGNEVVTLIESVSEFEVLDDYYSN